MVAAACICTCPPRAVCSSLSGGGTRTRRQQCRTKLRGPKTAPRTPASMGTDQMRTPAASSFSFTKGANLACFGEASLSCFDEASLSCFFSTAHHFILSSSLGRGDRSEGVASRLDEGLSGDSCLPFIGRAEHSIWLGGAAPEVVSPPDWLGHACDARPSLIGWRKRSMPLLGAEPRAEATEAPPTPSAKNTWAMATGLSAGRRCCCRCNKNLTKK